MRANKTLGQNFLKSRRALGQIVRAAEIVAGETILEIGPGKGVLTRVLLEAGARVVAIEKDERLVELLQETFAAEIANGTLVLKAGDILELDLASDAARALFPAGSTYKLVANIPYYITGQIIRTFLSAPAHLQPTIERFEEKKRMGRQVVNFHLKAPGRFGQIISFLPGSGFEEWKSRNEERPAEELV